MPKRRHFRQQAQESASQGIIVEAIESVTNGCRDVIRPIINNWNLNFVQENLARRRIKCTLTGAGVSNAITRERYAVHELLEKESTTYWLAISLYFQFQAGKYRLESISLIVFKGSRFDDTKTPLLRAEWDCSDETGLSKHAQPHWHIYSAALNTKEGVGVSEFDKPLDVEPFSPITNETTEFDETLQGEIDKFHFAMASKWHLEENFSLQEELNSVEALTRWIKGCINYIREQLSYLPSV